MSPYSLVPGLLAVGLTVITGWFKHVTRSSRRHRITFKQYGDATAQATCSCGWEGMGYGSGGEFYTWESRWDMAQGDAYRHLQVWKVIDRPAFRGL